MIQHGRLSRLTRLIPALVLVTTLAACGVDGEPETPTRAEVSFASEINVERPN